MFDKRFAAALMAGTLIAAPFAITGASAQTTTTPGTTTTPQATPNTSGSSTVNPSTSTGTSAQSTTTPSSSTTAAAGSMNGQQFADRLMPNQWLASKLMDQNVVGADNQKVGDINDLVLDGSGNVHAVVIGVGGFLGIGEKNVAVPFRSLEIQHNGSNAGYGTGSSASTSTNGTSTTAANNANNSNSSGSSMLGSSSDRIVLRMTKQELQNAPTFRTDSTSSGAATSSSSDMNTRSTTGTGTTTTAPAR